MQLGAQGLDLGLAAIDLLDQRLAPRREVFALVAEIEPGLPQQPGTLYLGADPGLLFRSDDAGETWEPNRGILEYPTRDRWVPGRGGVLCDSIQLDPGEPLRMYVCVTLGGYAPD